MPAMVSLPMRQLFGGNEGRTLSVVKDMPNKSPTIITMIAATGHYASSTGPLPQ